MGSTLDDHPYFQRWADPQSGVVSYILTERVAPVQQTFYFVNPSVSPDERWLWFQAAFPPSPHKMLAAVSLDPAEPRIVAFPASMGCQSSPMVAPESDAAYFAIPPSVYRQPIDGDVQTLCTLDEAFIAGRPVQYLTTHLTLSADGEYFLLDGEIGHHWFVALGSRRGGSVKVLREFGRRYNHGQFSPVDPKLFLLAQDWWLDPVSGQYFHLDHRLWLMDVDQRRFEPACPGHWFAHGTDASHEWWSPDGRLCWVDYQSGTFEMDLADRRPVHVWKRPLCHAHCDASRQYWCADDSPYQWSSRPCKVRFLDRDGEREIDVASGLPQPPISRTPLHIDPHPQFSPRGSYVAYTTTAGGKVDVALTPVEGILDRLRAGG